MTITQEIKNEIVSFGNAMTGLTVRQIATRLGLIEATVRRSLGELRRAGAVRYGNETYVEGRWLPTFVAVQQ